MIADPRLPVLLQETETRLQAFDQYLEHLFAPGPIPDGARTLLGEWRQLRPGLYQALGAAYHGLALRTLVYASASSSRCAHGIPLLSPCERCPVGIATETPP